MKPEYEILVRSDVLDNVAAYRDKLLTKSCTPGVNFKKVLKGRQIEDLTPESMLELLLQTKKPLFFAKRSLKGEGSDWTPEEVRILGDVLLGVEVTVFDNGSWKTNDAEFKIHPEPFKAHLVFVPGPLLTGPQSTDFVEIVQNDELIFENYLTVMKRRLEPAFDFINLNSSAERKAVVVIPGIGCGLFAGKFVKQLPSILMKTIDSILRKINHRLSNVQCVIFVPLDGESATVTIGNISYRVRPHLKYKRPMLSLPSVFEEEGDNFSNVSLFKLVAWDHFSYPGNNFFRCKRQTDDGVSAAATDCMAKVLGVKGQYNGKGVYLPPKNYTTWEEVVKANKILLQIDGNLSVSELSVK